MNKMEVKERVGKKVRSDFYRGDEFKVITVLPDNPYDKEDVVLQSERHGYYVLDHPSNLHCRGFKVGDYIRGTSNTYGITNNYMYLGKVVKVSANFIKIKVLDHEEEKVIGMATKAFHPEGKFKKVEVE